VVPSAADVVAGPQARTRPRSWPLRTRPWRGALRRNL